MSVILARTLSPLNVNRIDLPVMLNVDGGGVDQ